MKKSFLHRTLFFVLFLIVCIAIFQRLFFPPFWDIKELNPVIRISPYELFDQFIKDPPEAHRRYTDQVILLEGRITQVGNGFIIMGSDMRIVRCKLRTTIYDKKRIYSIGDEIAIKGVCRGITLTEVLLTHCVFMRNSE